MMYMPVYVCIVTLRLLCRFVQRLALIVTLQAPPTQVKAVDSQGQLGSKLARMPKLTLKAA